MSDKLPKMNKVEMVRSDISGQFFPSDECEIVVIKLIKHKEEKMTAYNPFSSDRPANIKTDVVENGKPITDVKGVDTSSPEFAKLMHTKRSIIPPAMKDIFSKPPELLGP